MPRPLFWFWPAAIALTLWGCATLSPPLPPSATGTPSPVPATTPAVQVLPSPTAPPLPTPQPITTGSIRGFVTGRTGRLGGARVSIGNASTMTSPGGLTVTDDVGNPIALGLGEFLLLKAATGSQTLSVSYDDASNSLPVTLTAGIADVTASPGAITRLSDDLFLPVDGPVATGSTAVGVVAIMLPGSSDNMIDVQKASSSADLQFTPSSIVLRLKAPPGSRGDTIGSYAITYLGAGNATMSSTIPQSVIPSSVTIPPAPGSSHSGPYQDLTVGIKYTGTDLQAAWNFTAPNATLKIDLFNLTGNRVVDRTGAPLIVRVPCLLVH